MAKLPFKKRMQDALSKFGISNGTRIEDGTLPSDIASYNSNEMANAWHDKHNAIRDLLRYSIMKSVGEKGYETAKAATLAAFGIDKSKLVAGHEETLVADNVACNIRVQNGRDNLSREKLLTVLVTDYKLTLADAQAAIEKSMVKSADAVYFTPSVVRE